MDSAQTVAKALDLLSVISEARRPLSVRAIAGEASISVGSAYRILNTLEQRDAIRRLPDGKIVLGIFLVRLANTIEYHPRLRMAAAGVMVDLRAECGMETVGLYVRLNTAEMTCIETIIGLHQIRNVEKPYEPLPIARGGVSLTFIASDLDRFGEKAVRQYLGSLPEGIRPENISLTIKQASKTLEQGVVFSSGDRISGAASIACPLPTRSSAVNSVIALSGTSERFSIAPKQHWSAQLKQAARRVVAALEEESG